MTVFSSIRARARHAGRIFLEAGPVGLIYAMKLAARQRQIHFIQHCIDRENELHRQTKATLNMEMNAAIAAFHTTSASAGIFWRHCQKSNTTGAQA